MLRMTCLLTASFLAGTVMAEVIRARDAILERSASIHASADPSVTDADNATFTGWLARRFLTGVNERRQRDLGVTHHI